MGQMVGRWPRGWTSPGTIVRHSIWWKRMQPSWIFSLNITGNYLVEHSLDSEVLQCNLNYFELIMFFKRLQGLCARGWSRLVSHLSSGRRFSFLIELLNIYHFSFTQINLPRKIEKSMGYHRGFPIYLKEIKYLTIYPQYATTPQVTTVNKQRV